MIPFMVSGRIISKASFFLLISCAGLLPACKREHMPKPIGYNRLLLPEPSYQALPDSFPYQFEYSVHAKLLRDTSAIRGRYWIEMNYTELKSNNHVTYKKLDNSEQLLKELMNDSYTLTAKHQIKANAIDEIIAKNPHGITAVIAELEGEVPSQMQFTITDKIFCVERCTSIPKFRTIH
jgi:gliding motility-associated lipoprotein GldD